jgi:hypothetical protein
MPVAAAQLVLVTAAESQALVGQDGWGQVLPLAASGPGEPLGTAAALLGVMSMWRAFYAVYIYSWSQADFVVSCLCTLYSDHMTISKVTRVNHKPVFRSVIKPFLSKQPAASGPGEPLGTAAALLGVMSMWRAFCAVYIYSWSQADFVVSCYCV